MLNIKIDVVKGLVKYGFYRILVLFQSVTSYGRTMIEQTKQEVEQHYCIANGYKHDAVVSKQTLFAVNCNLFISGLNQ